MIPLDQYLQNRLNAREQASLTRQRCITDSPQSAVRQIEGASFINFSSNDYLGLAADQRVAQAMIQGIKEQGVGSGASHLTAGHHRAHHALEEALAAFTGRDRALLFSSGYMANVGVITALMNQKDSIFQDRLNHASLLDAAQLSGAPSRRFAHLDYESLRSMLQRNRAANRLVVSDGVFSMDGDQADLKTLAKICQDENAWLMIDDAHGFGVLGDQGGGCAAINDSGQDTLPILVGTLGKSFGTAGAFVAGSTALIESLIQFSRTYIYTTALPPAIAQATLTSLHLLKTENWRRDHLLRLIDQFRHGCYTLGIPVMASSTPIQPILVGNADASIAISEHLKQAGCWVSAIRPPTVPQGTSRLRVTLTASHTPAQVGQLLCALESAWQRYHVAA